VPYHESTSEEAERIIQEHTQPLNVLVHRSAQLRQVRQELGRIHGLVKNSKRKEALKKIERLMTEISP
jgi:flagellar biosynthesis regulator FlbT